MFSLSRHCSSVLSSINIRSGGRRYHEACGRISFYSESTPTIDSSWFTIPAYVSFQVFESAHLNTLEYFVLPLSGMQHPTLSLCLQSSTFDNSPTKMVS